jgi:hypothetical protein
MERLIRLDTLGSSIEFLLYLVTAHLITSLSLFTIVKKNDLYAKP